jgi:hypothetical protein
MQSRVHLPGWHELKMLESPPNRTNPTKRGWPTVISSVLFIEFLWSGFKKCLMQIAGRLKVNQLKHGMGLEGWLNQSSNMAY